MSALQTVLVNEFTNAVLDPDQPMLGPVRDGGRIIVNTAAGCWGPMLTPRLKGGHEVSKPVFVEGAEPGDAIVIRIESVRVTSDITSSGVDHAVPGRANGDGFVAGVCPQCGTENPETHVKGVGKDAIRCDICGTSCAPFEFINGYTIAFDEDKQIGLTLDQKAAETVAADGRYYMQTPDNSIQNPVVTLAGHDIPGVVARVRPFIGQLGTTPRRAFPDSHNAGDFGSFLLDAPHEYAMTEEALKDRTDGHMDINKVREGAILICPVKVPGGGIEKSAPISVIGTGTNLNTAVDNALERTAALFDMTVPEVKNRVTITGAIEIGRAPGVVTASLRVPVRKLQEKGLWELVRDQYHMYR
jgi:formamidase